MQPHLMPRLQVDMLERNKLRRKHEKVKKHLFPSKTPYNEKGSTPDLKNNYFLALEDDPNSREDHYRSNRQACMQDHRVLTEPITIIWKTIIVHTHDSWRTNTKSNKKRGIFDLEGNMGNQDQESCEKGEETPPETKLSVQHRSGAMQTWHEVKNWGLTEPRTP